MSLVAMLDELTPTTFFVMSGPSSNQTATLGFYSSAGARKGLVYTDSGYMAVESDAEPIYLNAGGTTKVTVKTGGNVGIGTTGPGYKLDVKGTGYFDGPLYVGTTSNRNYFNRGDIVTGKLATLYPNAPSTKYESGIKYPSTLS